MAEINLGIEYHSGQDKVFFGSKERRRVVTKGRRWGFTKGSAQFIIEQMLSKDITVLWGDTVTSNIYNYVERYFLPILSRLPNSLWEWKKQERKLYINKSTCDFRSADQPENWEGFGYNIVILNEAGIILKNQYLWNNAVRPMLMDYPDSLVIIGGTPKGKNLFFDLYNKTFNEPGWDGFNFTSFDNPYLAKEEIDELIKELPEGVVRQEIYAEFSDVSSQVLIPYDLALECMKRELLIKDEEQEEIWGLDIARHGDDFSALAKRRWKDVYEVKLYDIQDTMQLASFVAYQCKAAPKKPLKIFVETTGIGWGVYDRLRELNIPVYPADVSMKSYQNGVLNKRAEMYIRLKDEMKKGLKIIYDQKLLRQMSAIEFEFTNKSEIKLVDKDMIKKSIGESPDSSDAVALTYFEEMYYAPEVLYKKEHKYKFKRKQATTWMAR